MASALTTSQYLDEDTIVPSKSLLRRALLGVKVKLRAFNALEQFGFIVRSPDLKANILRDPPLLPRPLFEEILNLKSPLPSEYFC